jgi:hypothetical protein
MKIHTGAMLITLTAVLPALPAQGQTGGSEIGFDVSAGYRQDSNVNIAATDTTTGEADAATLLSFGIDGSFPVADRLSFDLGYKYAGTAYETWSDFDLAVHHARAAVQYKFGGFDSAVSFDRFAAQVDGEQFLDIRQASPSLSRLIGDKLYLRGSYVRAEKNYSGKAKRNAFNEAIRADVYVLLDGMQRYLAFGYRMDSEDATANEFDYDGVGAKVAYGHGLQFVRLKLDLKMHLQFENRDYAGVSEAIGAPRRDERFRAGLNAAIPLSEHFALKGEVEYADNASNFAAANFDESVYSINLSAGF